MYKKTDKVINFITKAKKNWKVQLTVEGKTFSKLKIQKGIFQGDVLSPLLFVIAMMPLNHNMKGTTINHLMFMDDIKQFSKKKKKTKKNWKP